MEGSRGTAPGGPQPSGSKQIVSCELAKEEAGIYDIVLHKWAAVLSHCQVTGRDLAATPRFARGWIDPHVNLMRPRCTSQRRAIRPWIICVWEPAPK